MNIGVIGQGFVGTAVRECFRKVVEIVTYDKKEPQLIRYEGEDRWPVGPYLSDVGKGIDELLGKVNGPIFVCLPTPMLPNGSVDLSIVRQTVGFIEERLSEMWEEEADDDAMRLPMKRDIILKSTIPPGTTDSFKCLFTNIVFNPEFLREVSADDDFQNQGHVIFGGSPSQATQNLFEMVLPRACQYCMNPKEAEIIKYLVNCFLAVKVSFANEMKQICDAAGIDYDIVSTHACLDDRLGKSHWQVPGPDGHLGFGGSCFPKDINGLIRFAQSVGVIPNLLEAAWENNLKVRPERDWEQLKGRAVS
jgi:UDPglucose 6-dehydrogenase